MSTFPQLLPLNKTLINAANSHEWKELNKSCYEDVDMLVLEKGFQLYKI